MYKKRIRKLVAALRSGEFKQITERLRGEDNCYCVEGVMCELYGRAKRVRNMWTEDGSCILSDEVAAPGAVFEYFGIPRRVEYKGAQHWWNELNDEFYVDGKRRRMGFRGLAQLIERRFLNA